MSAATGADPAWTPKSVLEWSAGFLRGKGVETPRLDAELLLGHVLNCPRLNLYLQFDRPLDTRELAAYRDLVRARAARRPVAYLIGAASFWKLDLAAAPGCLIPRADTEILVEATLAALAAARARGVESPCVVELGTGSAAIPLAVCSDSERVRWLAVERSARALAVAAENRGRHQSLLAPRGNTLRLVRGERFDALAPSAAPHLIVSNPPYIPSGDIAGLMPEVSLAEPREALDGGTDGMDFHRYLLAFAAARLAAGGRLLMEIGHDQGLALRAEAERHAPLAVLAIHPDLGRRERVIELERRGE